jgi:hypothetical protein
MGPVIQAEVGGSTVVVMKSFPITRTGPAKHALF